MKVTTGVARRILVITGARSRGATLEWVPRPEGASMVPIRTAVLLATSLFLASSCGGGGSGGGGGDPIVVCLDCSGLGGQARLWCAIQNANRPGCDSPGPANAPPNAIDTFALTTPPVPGVSGSGGVFDVTVPDGTDVRALVPVFSVAGPPGAGVGVAGVLQTSGVTANDFTSPVAYAVVPVSGATNRQVVTVTIAPRTNVWTWVGGSNGVNQTGTYGSKGVAAAANIPGARREAVSWVDRSGQFWLFGGYGLGGAGSSWELNDLWKFDGSRWTWMGGASTINQPGLYGTKNTASSANVPGARQGAVSWADAGGRLWLFGGFGVDASGAFGWLNDLWSFDGTAWTWVSGSNTGNPAGVYGTIGVAAAGNVPEGRNGASAWLDMAGNFWVFGGAGVRGELSDLWKFDGANWTWVGGPNTAGQGGIYGTRGTAAPTNAPGARQKAASWADSSGRLWLFGGTGYAQPGHHGFLNDLWRFDGTHWTWVGGANVPDQPGVHGSSGVPAATNIPGARSGAATWVDATGSAWLFGGSGVDMSGAFGTLQRDLWKFDGTNWTWVGAPALAGGSGTYGASQQAIIAAPYGRSGGVAWRESSGKVWLFGGEKGNLLNDLMLYQP